MFMENPQPKSSSRSLPRVLIIGLVGVLIVLGLILLVRLTTQPVETAQATRPDALANSNDRCVQCHRSTSPGIVQQFGHSEMASAKVTCTSCHEVAANYPGAAAHEGTYVLATPTTAMCQKCHPGEVASYNQSRHGLPAWVAYVGTKDLNPALISQYQSIPEGQFAPDKARNAVAAMEGADITSVACETCHAIGQPAADNSVGECQKCHLRHEFSIEQVRKPETCNACHIGPDHPQWEIYTESPHGIMYNTNKDSFNWSAEPGTLTVKDFPAPTCSTCHMSGFGGTATTHDVGERLTWYLFASVSERRPAWQDNKIRMQTVCLQCHNQGFIDTFYAKADQATNATNGLVKQGQEITKPLYDQKILSSTPFDSPIKFVEFELWHHWGRTTKFGAWMQGPDYTQWHGAYEVEKALVELRDQTQQMLKPAGK
jgi:hydroxylamine dehydrogenase